jgi:hypothetical protein
MTAWEVDKRIGNVRNDSPELLQEQSTQPKDSNLFNDTTVYLVGEQFEVVSFARAT